MRKKIQKIKQKYEETLKSSEFAFKVQEIITLIYSLPSKAQNELVPLYKKIGQDLLDRDINAPNYDLSKFLKRIENWKESSEIDHLKKNEVSQSLEIVNDFEEALLNFLSESEKIISKLKGYFLFKLDNNSAAKTEILILYDKNFVNNPFFNQIRDDNPSLDFHKYDLEHFLEKLPNEPNLQEKRYLCLLLISPNITQDETIIRSIKSLFDIFTFSSFIVLKKTTNVTCEDYELKSVQNNIEAILDDIETATNGIFNNTNISYSEEIIIKKLFGKKSAILDYKILKPGKSASKVIEVQPIKNFSINAGRFVVKFGPKNSQGKIKKESEAFKEFIGDFTIQGYSADFEETETLEAIRYGYASSDSRKESYSFASVLDKSLEIDKFQVIENLFNCSPFEYWKETSPIEKKVRELYSKYINEEKILEVISRIKNESISETQNEDLHRNFETIMNQSLTTYEKVCHGDLHTENFFIDESGEVYLIDFGFTGNNHAIIDHATLESSLKFKHIPFYVPIDEIVEIECELYNLESFKSDFNLSFIKRENVRHVFELITKIREKSIEFTFNKSSAIEYFISLFIITFRQIQYADLNQLYALKTAEILAEKIVKDLSL